MFVGLNTAEQLHRMANEFIQQFEAIAYTGLAAGKIHDQRGAAHTGDAARKPRISDMLRTAGTERFSDAWDVASYRSQRCFRCYVTGRQAGSAGCENDITIIIREVDQTPG